jgi:hypothetical protein
MKRPHEEFGPLHVSGRASLILRQQMSPPRSDAARTNSGALDGATFSNHKAKVFTACDWTSHLSRSQHFGGENTKQGWLVEVHHDC